MNETRKPQHLYNVSFLTTQKIGGIKKEQMEEEYKSIRLSVKAAERIKKLGNLGDTYESVIMTAIALLEKQRK